MPVYNHRSKPFVHISMIITIFILTLGIGVPMVIEGWQEKDWRSTPAIGVAKGTVCSYNTSSGVRTTHAKEGVTYIVSYTVNNKKYQIETICQSLNWSNGNQSPTVYYNSLDPARANVNGTNYFFWGGIAILSAGTFFVIFILAVAFFVNRSKA